MNLSLLLIIVIQCIHRGTADPIVAYGQAKITGGHKAKPYSYPYIVSLQTRIWFLRAHICGGVLVSETFVLSAAHCATESWLITWLPMDAVAGVYDVNKFTSQTQVMPIKERIPHPRYNGGIGPHDIALFKTSNPFTFTRAVWPIKLAANDDYKAGEPLTLIGWGVLRTTYFIPDMPDGLHEVNVSYLPYEECFEAIDILKESNDVNPLDDEANICTGPLTGGIAACVGDSGGPLLKIINDIPPARDPISQSTEEYNATLYNCPNTKENKDNQDKATDKEGTNAILVGIVSWGVSPCGEEGAPTVYTNAKAYKYFVEYIISHE